MSLDPTRRYSEEEVERILEQAAEAQVSGSHSTPARREGMTLAEIQEIASEAGISTSLVVRAATDIDRPIGASEVAKTYMGAPLEIGRTVHLPRELTEREWDRLVVDLRETMDAPGEITEDGNFKQWQEGSFEALLEPTDEAYRLRMKSKKKDAKAGLGVGVFYGAAAPLLGIVLAVAGAPIGATLGLSALIGGAAGWAYFGTRHSTNKWAAKSELDMERVAGRLLASMGRTDAESSVRNEAPEESGNAS